MAAIPAKTPRPMGSTATFVPGRAKFVVGFVGAWFVAATSAAEVAVEPPDAALAVPVPVAAAEPLTADPETYAVCETDCNSTTANR
jgi:hypothetical protein